MQYRVGLALAALALLSGACGGGADDTGGSPPPPPAATSPGKGSVADKPAGIGTPVRDGKFEFTVTAVKCGVKQVGNASALGKKAQGQFCLVTLTVRNIGKEAALLSAEAQKAFGADGSEFSADSEASLYANEGKPTLFLAEINPGNKIQGARLVFDIPEGARLAKLVLHDSLFSDGVELPLA